jgi:hypothetical protein
MTEMLISPALTFNAIETPLNSLYHKNIEAVHVVFVPCVHVQVDTPNLVAPPYTHLVLLLRVGG